MGSVKAVLSRLDPYAVLVDISGSADCREVTQCSFVILIGHMFGRNIGTVTYNYLSSRVYTARFDPDSNSDSNPDSNPREHSSV